MQYLLFSPSVELILFVTSLKFRLRRPRLLQVGLRLPDYLLAASLALLGWKQEKAAFLPQFIRAQYSLPAPFWRTFNISCHSVDALTGRYENFVLPAVMRVIEFHGTLAQ
jgi:hypothetical protein